MAFVTTMPLSQDSNNNKIRDSNDVRVSSREWASEFGAPQDTEYKPTNFFGALPMSFLRSTSNSSTDMRIPSESSLRGVLSLLDKTMPKRSTSKSSIDLGGSRFGSIGTLSNISSIDFGSLQSSISMPTASLEPVRRGVSSKDWATAYYLQTMGLGDNKSSSRTSSGSSFSLDEATLKDSLERSVASTIGSSFQDAVKKAQESSKASSVKSWPTTIMEPMKPPAPVNPTPKDHPSDTFAAVMSIVEQGKKKDQGTKKSKPRVRRHAKEPENKLYVDEPTQVDVLFGRGTGPRLHPGNQRYYIKVGQLRDDYRSGGDADKKRTSRLLVNWVKESGGRFLKQDSDGRYYVVPELGARSKACQALREHKFPNERK